MRRAASTSPQETRTILVVDDDPDVRESIVDVLEIGGFAVMTATHGLEAIRALRTSVRTPDLILLDMLMPVMGGRDFRIEQRRDPEIASIPVVVVTAYGVPADEDDVFDGVAVLKKPFDISELMRAVEHHMHSDSSPGN